MNQTLQLDNLYQSHVDSLLNQYQQAFDKFDYQGVIISAGIAPQVFQDDYNYPFKVNHHFKHWLPICSSPHSMVLIRPNQKPSLIYFAPRDFWHAPVPTLPSVIEQVFDVVLVTDKAKLREQLPSDLTDYAALMPEQALAKEWGIGNINPDNLNNFVRFHRALKSDYEIACIERAVQKATLGHLAAQNAFAQQGSELDIHLAYLGAIGDNERELPYDNIVGLNEHGAILHYDQYQAAKPDNYLSLLIDAGASFNGYAADITRTYSAQDDFFNALIQQLDKLMRDIVDELKPGVSLNDCQRLTHRKIAQLFIDIELVSLSVEQMIEDKVTHCFYPHGLGHYLGLQVHDVGGTLANPWGDELERPKDYPNLRYLRDLEAGNVITIEPGIYFIDMLLEELQASKHSTAINWALIDKLKPYGGIRIEDDILITNDGFRNISREALAQQS
jgi:Xaa-Pro dipeptidase